MTYLEPPLPRAQAVADSVRVIVRDRGLMPGDKLPSEHELVNLLGVGRSSIREGVQLLEALGIVTVEQGRGTFLSTVMGAGLRRVVDWAYDDGDGLERLPADLLEARRVIEIAQVRFAALRATDEEIETLRRISGDPGHVTGKVEDLVEGGLGFHHQLAVSAHNDILLIMSNAVRPMLLVRFGTPSLKEIGRLHPSHAVIADAITRRDPDDAAEAMRQHMDEIGRAVCVEEYSETRP
jgi:GntR family transcriptional regulator, transcriptional repressor for pyruvate dehydrogenase complex